jgi:hypothetical protein
MSDRPLIAPTVVIAAGDMSANIISTPTILQRLSMVSYDVSWTGSSPVGTLSVQVSNTYSQNGDGTVRNPGNWTTATLNYNGTQVTTIPVSGSTGNGFIDVDATGAYAMRLIYTFTSGTGTMTAVLASKVA